jgi:hypothetical protein
MEWRSFFQLAIIFPIFIGGLTWVSIILQKSGLDTSFLISFILAILTIVLSIYYSEGTNKIFNLITEKIQSIKDDNKSVSDKICSIEGKLNKHEEHNKDEGEKENGQ